jgi:hypothetical protein
MFGISLKCQYYKVKNLKFLYFESILSLRLWFICLAKFINCDEKNSNCNSQTIISHTL